MKSAVVILLCIIACMTGRAETIVGSSLEWLADSSAGIGLYQVTQSQKTSASGFELSFQLDEVLKGSPPKMTGSSYWVRFKNVPNAPAPTVTIGDRFLVFLKADDKGALRVAHLINLSQSQVGGHDSVAINSKFEVLKDPEQIMALVRKRLKSHPNAVITKWHEYPNPRFDVQVPPDSPAFMILYAGSMCYLFVPDDLKPTKQFVTVYGESRETRRIEWTPDLTVIGAITASGGYTGTLEKIFIVRGESRIAIELDSISKKGEADPKLQPNDRIEVPRGSW